MTGGELLAWLLREKERRSEHNFNATPVWIEDRQGLNFSVNAAGSYEGSGDLWIQQGREELPDGG